MTVKHASYLGARLLGISLMIEGTAYLAVAVEELTRELTTANVISVIATIFPFFAGLWLFRSAGGFGERMERAVTSQIREEDDERAFTPARAAFLGAVLIGLRLVAVYAPLALAGLYHVLHPQHELFPNIFPNIDQTNYLEVSHLIRSALIAAAGAMCIMLAPRLPHVLASAHHDERQTPEGP